MTTVTYTNARLKLKKLCDQVSSTREPVIIHRRDAEDVALVSADELESLTETAHLLHSPENAKRSLTALLRAQSKKEKPGSIQNLKKESGLQEK